MRRLLFLGLVVLVVAALGCGSDKERGINSAKDRPRTTTNKAE